MDDATAAALVAYGDKWNDEFKKRGMPTVPNRATLIGEGLAKKEAQELSRMADPFKVEQVYNQANATVAISIQHPDYGFAVRHINTALLAATPSAVNILCDKVVEMKQELGYSVNKDFAAVFTSQKTKVPMSSESQRHTCKEHGNQLVSAQNPKTGETALRCPVDGCTTILRKQRKEGPSKEAKAAWMNSSPTVSPPPPPVTKPLDPNIGQVGPSGSDFSFQNSTPPELVWADKGLYLVQRIEQLGTEVWIDLSAAFANVEVTTGQINVGINQSIPGMKEVTLTMHPVMRVKP